MLYLVLASVVVLVASVVELVASAVELASVVVDGSVVKLLMKTKVY